MRPTWLGIALACGLVIAPGCAVVPRHDPLRYRLAHSGSHWDVVGSDPVLADLEPRYPEFFALVLDPARSEEPRLLVLRDDLERQPTTRRNYDALNALAIAYFELNYRGEAQRGSLGFISSGFRAAKIAAVPWRAYGDIVDPRLRDAILDFYEDAATGEKLGSAATGARLAPIVASLERKEPEAGRRARIQAIAARLRGDPEAALR